MSFKDLELDLVKIDSKDDEYDIPLDISDILTICQEYSKLGYNIQNQITQIIDLGVEDSIKSGLIKQESIPHIKNFLTKITQNAYFGDSCAQSFELINKIEKFNKNLKRILDIN